MILLFFVKLQTFFGSSSFQKFTIRSKEPYATLCFQLNEYFTLNETINLENKKEFMMDQSTINLKFVDLFWIQDFLM